MHRTCRSCGVQKNNDEFPGDTHHTCRECQNAKKREKLKQKKIANNKLLSNLLELVSLVKVYENDGSNIDNIYDLARNFVQEVRRIKENDILLSFLYKLEPETYRFLRICLVDERKELKNVRNMIKDKNFTTEFQKIYGIEPESVAKEVDELYDTISGMRTFYDEFIDAANKPPRKPIDWVKFN